MSYDLEHPPVDEWRDEQDRSEWFEEAAHHWRGKAEGHGGGPMTIDALREHIEAVVGYNWSTEYRDALENGPEGHVIEHLIALAAFLGTPLSEEDRHELYAER